MKCAVVDELPDGRVEARGHGGALRDVAHDFDDAKVDRGRTQHVAMAVGGEGVEEGVGGGLVGLAFLADEPRNGR
jgi:hypothetical protein